MHAAKIESSARLQRVLRVLSDGAWHTTRDLVYRAEVCAVNSCIAELRVAGANITCRREKIGDSLHFCYRMNSAPAGWAA